MTSLAKKRQSSVMFAKGTKFHDKATAAGALFNSNSNGANNNSPNSNGDWGGFGGMLDGGQDDSDSDSSDDEDGFRRNANNRSNGNGYNNSSSPSQRQQQQQPQSQSNSQSQPQPSSRSQPQQTKSNVSKSSTMRDENNRPRQSWGMRAAAVGDRPPDSASQNPQSLKLLGLKSAREGGTKYGGASSGLTGSRGNSNNDNPSNSSGGERRMNDDRNRDRDGDRNMDDRNRNGRNDERSNRNDGSRFDGDGRNDRGRPSPTQQQPPNSRSQQQDPSSSSRPPNSRQQIQPSPDFEMVGHESDNQSSNPRYGGNESSNRSPQFNSEPQSSRSQNQSPNQPDSPSSAPQGRAPVQKGYVDRLSRTINFNSNPNERRYQNQNEDGNGDRRQREDSDGFGGMSDYSNDRNRGYNNNGNGRNGDNLGIPPSNNNNPNNRPVSPLTAVATELGLKTPINEGSIENNRNRQQAPGNVNRPPNNMTINTGNGNANANANANQRPNGPSREQSDYFGPNAMPRSPMGPPSNQGTQPFNPQQRSGPLPPPSPNNRNGPPPPHSPMTNGPSPPQAAARNPSPFNPQVGPQSNNRGPPPLQGNGRDGGFGYERPLLNNGNGNGPSPPMNAARGPPGGGMNGGNMSPTMRGGFNNNGPPQGQGPPGNRGPGPNGPNGGMGMRGPPPPSGNGNPMRGGPPPPNNNLGPNNSNMNNSRGPSPGPSFSDSQGPRPQQSVWRRSMAMFGGGNQQGPPTGGMGNANGRDGNGSQLPRQNLWRRSMALLGAGGGPQPPRPPPQRAPSEDELEEKPVRVAGFERELEDSKPTPRKSLYLGGGPSGMEWDYSGEGGNKFWRRFSMAQHHANPNDKIEASSKAFREKNLRGTRRAQCGAALGGMIMIGGIVGVVIWRENVESSAHSGGQPTSVDHPTGGLVSLNPRDVETFTRVANGSPAPQPSSGAASKSWLDSFTGELLKERSVEDSKINSRNASLDSIDDQLPESLQFGEESTPKQNRRRHHEKLARRQRLSSSSSSSQ